MLRLDARRAAPLVAVPALAVAGVAAAWRTMMPGVDGWDNAVVALMASVRWMGPLAAALAAWLAVREHRLGYLRGLTARSPATGPLLDLLLLTHAALLAYGMAAMVVIGETVLTQRPGTAHPLGLLAGAVTLTLHVVVGYLAGRLAPHTLTVAAAGVVTGLWAALRGPGGSWLNLVPPATVDRLEPFTTLRPGLPADQLLWAASLTTALVTGYVLVLTRHRPLLVPLVCALALTSLGTHRLSAQQGAAVPAQVGHVCRQWPLMICVHPALDAALPVLETALTPLAARLSTTPAAFTRVMQRPDSEPAGIRGGVAFVHLTSLTPGFEGQVVRQIQATVADPRSCARPRHPSGRAYRTMVDVWLRGEEAPPAAPSSSPKPATGNLERASVAASIRAPAVRGFALASQRFAGWDENRRRAWLAAHYEEYRSCSLAPRHFR
ncbi:hypothetical protein SAMN04489712_102459 [Thermomonospora echinospora]|uniref:Uncharacterized protein n=1 Tax=Thermomonospora echinospora TaxID=1992 RepID=A0A1H5VU06_9ACTN|nr:hypothetical protein SAMN04489712_102459 [Thermomonospora echinospora]